MQLLGDLIDRVQRAVEREGDPRQALVVGRADGERVDVEAAPGEQAGDPGQDPGLVLDEDRKRVLAAGAQASGRLQFLEAQQLLGPGLAHVSPPSRARPRRGRSSGRRSPPR